MDDENTMHLWYNAYLPPAGSVVPPSLLEKVHVYDVPFVDARGRFIVDFIDGQDIAAWITQGAIADRTQENLGASDIGIAIFRRMLKRELKKIERGEDPIGVLRDSGRNQRIDLPNERKKHHFSEGFGVFIRRTQARYAPVIDELIKVYEPA